MIKINFRIRFFLDKRIGQVMCRVRWNHSLCEVEFSNGVYAQEEKWNKDLQKAKIRTGSMRSSAVMLPAEPSSRVALQWEYRRKW